MPVPVSPDSTPPAAALTSADVGRLLQCSGKTVERLAGAVPGRFKLGWLVRFDRAAVLAWVAAGCPSAK